jgi:hypothetical protein
VRARGRIQWRQERRDAPTLAAPASGASHEHDRPSAHRPATPLLLKKSGELQVTLVEVPVPEPGADEVLVRVEASPVNPSDLGLLFSAADMTKAVVSGTPSARSSPRRCPKAR